MYYLSILGFKLNHVSKRGPWNHSTHKGQMTTLFTTYCPTLSKQFNYLEHALYDIDMFNGASGFKSCVNDVLKMC